jgi:RND family efflux transporter MFP subunit
VGQIYHLTRPILISLILVACSPGAKPVATPLAAVETAIVEPDGGASGLVVFGTLERQREMDLAFRVGGVMTALAVDIGDVVSAGEVVARIDPSAVNARVTQAEADLERTQRDLRRDEALFADGFVSSQRIEDRRSALKAAQAAYDAAAFDGRWSRLVAPTGGVVLERLAQAGEVVQPGQAVIRIADLSSPLVLRVPVADRDLAQVSPGQAVRAVVDAIPGPPLPGKVVRIGQGADPRTGTVTVEVELPGRTDLRSGLTGKAIFASGGGVQGVVRVPSEAVIEARGEEAFVFRLKGDRIARTQVVFLGFDGDSARMRGLSPGERVVTAGGGFVSDGQKVRIADARALSGALR